MKTAFSTIVLSLLLCVAGSYATGMDRSLKINQARSSSSSFASSSSRGSSGLTNQAYNSAVQDVRNALLSAIASANGNVAIAISSGNFAIAIAGAFTRSIDRSLFSLHSQGNGFACATRRVNSRHYSNRFGDAVAAAFDRSGHDYARGAKDCFANGVRSASSGVFRNFNYRRCTNSRRNSLYDRLISIGYDKTIANTARRCGGGSFNQASG